MNTEAREPRRNRKSENYGDPTYCTRSRFPYVRGERLNLYRYLPGQITDALDGFRVCTPPSKLLPSKPQISRYTRATGKKVFGNSDRGGRRGEGIEEVKNTPGERVQRGPFNQYHVSRMHRATLDHAIQLFYSSRRGPNAVRGGNKTSGLVYARPLRDARGKKLYDPYPNYVPPGRITSPTWYSLSTFHEFLSSFLPAALPVICIVLPGFVGLPLIKQIARRVNYSSRLQTVRRARCVSRF